VFTIEDKISDTLTDKAGSILEKINKIKTYTGEKKQLLKELCDLLSNEGYIKFPGHVTHYHLARVGESCRYVVPLKRKGHLAKFVGKEVRIICVATRPYDRMYMAGIVCN
jgi:hypothetical protein